MGKEIYLECPRGINCESLCKVLQKLVEDSKNQKRKLDGYLEKYKSKEKIKIEEAKEQICQLDVKPWIQKKLVQVMEITDRSVWNVWEGEEAFSWLLKLGIELDQLGVEEIKVNLLGEGTKALVQRGESLKIRKILSQSSLQVEFLQGECEMLTVNSIAFLSVFGKSEKFSGSYFIEKSVYVEGENPVGGVILTRYRDYNEQEKRDVVRVLETNVDDCSGEQLGYAMECLMKAGALDASCFPIYMKKHRPAYMLQVICKEEKQRILENIIFQETTSIGLRRYEEHRRILPRNFQEIELKDGHVVKIKICEHHGQKFYYPEYETVKKVCQETGRPYRSVYDEAAAIAGGLR